jgi:hypothetical protein
MIIITYYHVPQLMSTIAHSIDTNLMLAHFLLMAPFIYQYLITLLRRNPSF